MKLISLVSPSFEISLNNPLTSNLYRMMKANEWIARNYENLCNNERVDCNVSINSFYRELTTVQAIIEEQVKVKLDLLAQKMMESQDNDTQEEYDVDTDNENDWYSPPHSQYNTLNTEEKAQQELSQTGIFH